MSTDARVPHLRALYLDLLRDCLTGLIYDDPPLQWKGAVISVLRPASEGVCRGPSAKPQTCPSSRASGWQLAQAMAVVPEGFGGVGVENAVAGAAESRSTRPVVATPGDPTGRGPAGGMGQRRVLVHSSGFKLSPYADIKPAGEETKQVARKLWHRSPGSAG